MVQKVQQELHNKIDDYDRRSLSVVILLEYLSGPLAH